MFNLIITVISIALVAALALASIYYGGDALSQGSARATAATLINQGQQVSGAAQMYEAVGNTVSAVSDLSDDTDGDPYLSAAPAVPAAFGSGSWAYDSTDEEFTVTGDAENICLEVEKEAGRDTVETSAQGGTFGCFDDSGTYTFYYSK